jgi:hypothetical protein
MWSITVALVVTGVGDGDGEGPGTGVGVGTALAVVAAVVFPPHDASANVTARVVKARTVRARIRERE